MSRRIKTVFSTLNKIRSVYSVDYRPIRVFTENTKFQIHSETHSRKKDGDLKIGQKGSINKLEELLSFRTLIAREIVLKYRKFLKISGHNIVENYDCCINSGITKETLRNYPQILAELDIPLKIKELQTLPYNINITTPLLLMTYNKLNIFVTKEISTKRIILLSKLLEIEECEVCKQLVNKSFLISLNLNLLENNIKLLTDFGITKEDLVKDLWVLKYSSSLIKERYLLAKQNNIETFKTWMVRAQLNIFETYIKRRSETKSILGNNSLAEYLSERLDCTEEVAEYLIAKQPALKNKSLKKMNEMIDFLLKHGFQPIHIRRVPKILLHSVETTEKRLKELEAEGMQLDTLYMLTKSQKQYMQYYEAFIKTNKNKLKN